MLVIDDERLTRQLCVDILEKDGISVLTAEDARSGLQKVQEHTIDVVLMDVMMPELGGLEALRILQAKAPDIPVIIITAYPSSQVAIEALKSGAYDFIAKPFPSEELINVVRRALERRHLLIENRRLLEELQQKVKELSHLYSEAERFTTRLEEKVKERTSELETLLSENAKLYQQIQAQHRELVSSKQLLDNVLSHMSSGLLVTDLEGKVKVINRPGEETLGYSKENVLNRCLVDMFSNSRPMLEVKPDAISREVQLDLPDGRTISLGYSNSYLLGENGECEGIIIVFRDLSEIKKLQEEIRRKDRLATIGEIVAGVAHEIRNPLFGITSVVQVLSGEVHYNETHQELISAMLSETRRLNALLDDLLFYGRPTRLSLTPTDLAAIWEETLELVEKDLEKRKVRVIRSYEKGAPFLDVDQDKIKQVFLNLLKNAIEATPDGGNITIEIRGQGAEAISHQPSASKGFVEISVSDTGPGIPPENLEKVFDPFFTTKPRGAGLGLAISRKIVEDHGGHIEVRSSPGQGATFTVRLPLITGSVLELFNSGDSL